MNTDKKKATSTFFRFLRGLIFTLLVPGVVGVVVPMRLAGGAVSVGGWHAAGWLAVIAGAGIYSLCFFRFLGSGGTPAIFFTQRLKAAIGEEPGRLVAGGLYRVSRNPMYVGVVLAVLGEAIVWASWRVAVYGPALWAFFHLVVVLVEEPHLRGKRGVEYEDYCRTTPRWF